MACALTKSTTRVNTFTGATGAKFTIDVFTTTGQVGIITAVYGPIGSEAVIHAGQPFTFTMLPGRNILTLLGQGTVADARCQIVEVCDPANSQPLRPFQLADDGHFTVSFATEGV